MDDAHDGFDADPAAGSLPFDSMANLRALGDIQRRGLEAANLVISRLVAQVDHGGPLFGAEPPGTSNGAAPTGNGSDGSDLMSQYASLVSSFMGALLGASAAPSAAAGSTRPAPRSGIDADPLEVAPAAAGHRSTGELWLHNRSGASVTDVRVHCGDLRSHDGWAIPSSSISFDPDHLDELPDLASRGIRVAIDVPEDTPPGTYRGTVLAANLPAIWLALSLEVVADS